MTAALPTLARLKPDPDWARLPLFNRKNWSRFRFGDAGQRNLTLGLAQELPVPIPPGEVISVVLKILGEFAAAKQSVEAVLKNAISVGGCITNEVVK